MKPATSLTIPAHGENLSFHVSTSKVPFSGTILYDFSRISNIFGGVKKKKDFFFFLSYKEYISRWNLFFLFETSHRLPFIHDWFKNPLILKLQACVCTGFHLNVTWMCLNLNSLSFPQLFSSSHIECIFQSWTHSTCHTTKSFLLSTSRVDLHLSMLIHLRFLLQDARLHPSPPFHTTPFAWNTRLLLSPFVSPPHPFGFLTFLGNGDNLRCS